MTDFSMIPSYFIDDASLLARHLVGQRDGRRTGRTGEALDCAGGGRRIRAAIYPGHRHRSRTFDEFLRLTYGDERWQASTRAVYSSPRPTTIKYRNHDKKENVYDDERNIVGFVLSRRTQQERRVPTTCTCCRRSTTTPANGDRFGLNAWYIHSNRGTAPADDRLRATTRQFDNRTARTHAAQRALVGPSAAGTGRRRRKPDTSHSWTAYDYRQRQGQRHPGGHDPFAEQDRIPSTGRPTGEYSVGGKWLFTAGLSAHQHFVESADKNIIRQQGDKAVVGYDKGRIELDGSLSAKWRPTERLGLVGRPARRTCTEPPGVPRHPRLLRRLRAFRSAATSWRKASVSRNYRFPTLNDLYFLPGGNPDLQQRTGRQLTTPALSFAVGKEGALHAVGVGVVVRPAHRRLDSVAADGKGILLAA